jgi:hypothetical protein
MIYAFAKLRSEPEDGVFYCRAHSLAVPYSLAYPCLRAFHQLALIQARSSSRISCEAVFSTRRRRGSASTDQKWISSFDLAASEKDMLATTGTVK